MNSLVRAAQFPRIATLCRNSLSLTGVKLRSAHSSSPTTSSGKVNNIDLNNFDPNNYFIEPRVTTLDDNMEPYGSWKVAYEAERKAGNFALIRGFLCLSATLTMLYYSGIFDGVIMPNLDNIMEDTEPFNFDKEGRKTV